MSRLKKSPIEGLTLSEFQQTKRIFQFFDLNKDGFISEVELNAQLSKTKRGPEFDSELIRQMVKTANTYNHPKGVSFEEFIAIMQPTKSEKVEQQTVDKFDS